MTHHETITAAGYTTLHKLTNVSEFAEICGMQISDENLVWLDSQTEKLQAAEIQRLEGILSQQELAEYLDCLVQNLI